MIPGYTYNLDLRMFGYPDIQTDTFYIVTHYLADTGILNSEQSGVANISGTWLGTYWQQGIPTRFEATLIQSGNALTGSILDDSYLGEAHLTGEVTGRNVSFLKRYLTTSPAPVKYIGNISKDEDYIQGDWTIDTFNSGSWEARRSGENLSMTLQVAREKLTSMTNQK